MRGAHRSHAKSMRDTHGSAVYHARMLNTETASTRTLTIVLEESDWRALRAAEPDAIGWLQARIRERLTPPSPKHAATSNDTYDDY